MRAPRLDLLSRDDGRVEARLLGDWVLAGMLPEFERWSQMLQEQSQRQGVYWNLADMGRMDSAAAVLIWTAWGRRSPAAAHMRADQQAWFARLAGLPEEEVRPPAADGPARWIVALGRRILRFGRHFAGALALLGQAVLDAACVVRHPGLAPWREFSASVFKAGVLAMPVVALTGLLIGIVLSYLSALQLRNFGADIYLVNILGLGIIRELGPIMTALLVAGRSGSAMTAQLGVMRVTEEIDALAVMGISHSLRLVLPKVLALAVAMPLLVLWGSGVALLGGMLAAQVLLDLDMAFFFETLPRVVPASNLVIGLSKGVVFGAVVGLVACHFGLRVKPNTESLATNTTRSVVTAIVLVILVDAVFAVSTRGIGTAVV